NPSSFAECGNPRRSFKSTREQFDGFRCAPPILHATSVLRTRCPSGKSPGRRQNLSTPRCKIFHFTEILIYRTSQITSARQRGVSRSSRHAGRDAVDAAASARGKRLQGGNPLKGCSVSKGSRGRHGAVTALSLASTVSARQPLNVRRGRPRTAKSCGPGARSWRQVLP